MGANSSRGNRYHSLPNKKGKAIQRENRKTPLDQKDTNLKSYRSSKNQVDIGRQLEKNVLQDGVQVHGAKKSPSCSVTKREEVDNVRDIIAESEVIVSLPSVSAESKCTVDQTDGAIGLVNSSVVCDRFSHGSSKSVLADEISTSDQGGGDGNGRIELVHSCDRGSNVSGSLGPADGKNACDRGGHDKSGFASSDSRYNSKETNLKSYRSSKNQDDVEVDTGRQLEKNVLQDGVYVHGAKNSPSCSVTERMEVDNVSSSNAKTEIVMDGEKGDIITEGEVIVSFSSISAESKCAVDQMDGAIGPVNSSVACDRFSHGSSNSVLADEESTPDQGGDGNGRIELVHSCDRGSNVSGSLGSADCKNACDRGGHDKSGIESSDSRNITDGKKACDRVDHYKIGFGSADGKKTCDRGNHDDIGFGPCNGKMACYRDDHDKGSTGSAHGKSPFDCAFHTIGSIRIADSKVVCAHVGQASSTIDFADDKDVYDLFGHTSSRDGSADDSNSCDRSGSCSIGAPDDKSAFGQGGDVSGGIEFVYEDNCDSGGEVSGNVRHAHGKEVRYLIKDDSNSTTSEADDDNDGACGNNSGGIWYTDKEENDDEEKEEEDYLGEGVLLDSTKKSQIESINLCHFSTNDHQSPWPVQLPAPLLPLTDEGNCQSEFKTSKGAFNEGRKRNNGSLSKCQLSRTKTENDLETQSCAKATLDEHVLMVSGLSDATTKDGLLNFIEVLSGGEVKDITMMKHRNALVTMSTQVQDIAKMKEKCKKRTLDKSTVTIETPPAPTSILVSGLSPSVSYDLLTSYFESPRSQGGAVEKVYFTSKSGQAVVVFNNTQDMKRVLARQEEHPHVLNGLQLTVSIYHEFLQDSNSDPADLPSPFPTRDKFDREQVTQQSMHKEIQRQIYLTVDPDIMEFVYESSHLDQLTTLLKDEEGVIDWTPGSRHAVIMCTDILNDDSCQSLCMGIVQLFLDKFVKWDVRIEDDLRDTLQAGSMSAVFSCLEDDPPLVRSITNDSTFYLRIVSLKSKKEFYDKILQDKLLEMYRQERRKSHRVEKITSISEEKITLLRKINFVQTLQDEFKELTVVFDTENREIHLEGPQEELICAKKRCQVQEGNMKEKELYMPKSILKVLSTVEGLQVVEAEMAANQIEAVLILERTDEANPHCIAAKVLGVSPDHTNKASNLISFLTAETMVNIEERDILLTATPEWKQICAEIVQNGMVVIQRDDTGKMWVGGFSKDVSSSVKRLNSFLKENAAEELTEELSCSSKDARTYLRKCREDDLAAIQKRLYKFDVKILDGQDARTFVISGRKEGLAIARQTLNTLVHEIVTKEMKLKQPGLRTFFSSGKAGDLVEKLEKDQKCVVRVEKIFPKIETERPAAACAFAESDSTDSEVDEIVYVEDKSGTPPSNHAASFSVTTQGHTISWKTGNIAQERAHTVVIPQGTCADAVKRSAGLGMLLMAPRAGKIRVSTGSKMPCQHVIHTRCSEWEGGLGEGTLRDIVRKSLCKVDKLKGSSIAFPVIGAGNLQFPPNEASRIMLDEVINFCSSNPHSCVKDIRFVVFDQDQSLIAAFQQEMYSLQVRFGGTITNPYEVTWWRMVEVVHGNLTRERADAIVNIIGKDMDLYGAGELSKAVAKDGGKQVIQECRRLGKQPGGSAVMTRGGNLPARHIIHLVPDSSKKKHLQSCVEKCLLLASSSGLKSIAIPAIGTGAYQMTATDSAQLTFQALRCVRGSCASFSRIRIVIYQQDMLGAFTQEHQRVMQLQKQDLPVSAPTAPTAKPKLAKKLLAKKKKKQPSVTSSSSESTVHIFVTGANEIAVGNAVESLKTGFFEACTSQKISNECVSQLSDKQVTILLQNSRKRDVELKIEPSKNQIEVRGESKDVTVMIGEIWQELNERLKRARAREHAKLLSGHVEWCYVLYGKTWRFSSTKNAIIEDAYNKKCISVTVDIGRDKFELNFKKSTGIGSLSGERVTINRKVLGPTEVVGISLPSCWTPMPRQRNGNEVTVHTVRLAPHSSEFQSVVQEFQKTAGTVAITSIERIQNPLLYQAYQLRKQKMDKDNGGNNERQLFHGTASGNVKKINSQGFNRNFSGVAHGTALGKGVYFARDASFSMKYIPQDTRGGRFMYLARVLVGRYCHGDSTLVVPPARDPLRPEILFDSVVDDTTNPRIFVVFSDSQCYPEYLIAF